MKRALPLALLSLVLLAADSAYGQDSAADTEKQPPATEEGEPTTPDESASDEPAAQSAEEERPPALRFSTPPKERFDPKDAIKKISEHEYEIGGIRLDKKAGTVEFDGLVNQVKGPLEFVLTTPHGSVHETLLTTEVSPFELNVALLLMGFKVSETFFYFPEPEAFPQLAKDAKFTPAEQVEISVSWKDEKGTPQSGPVEQWIYNSKTKSTISPGPWIYTGSLVTGAGDFVAEKSGNLIALYIDPGSLCNNPRQDNDNDDIWSPHTEKIPAKGTPVRITMKLAQEVTETEAAPEKTEKGKKTEKAAKAPKSAKKAP